MIVTLVSPARAEEYSDGGMASIVLQADGNQHGISVRNLTRAPMTFTVYFTRFDDMVSEVKLTPFMDFPSVTVACPPLSDALACTLTARGQNSNFYVMFYYSVGVVGAGHDDSTVYELPFDPGASFYVAQAENGMTHQGEHFHAVDWMMPDGAQVRAARGGIVSAVNVADTGYAMDESHKLRTNYIRIAQDDGTVASYEHIQQNGAVVKLGQNVTTGDVIGYSGDVGYGSGPHLHFVVQSPLNGRERRSHPVRFRTANGIVTPTVGVFHTAADR